MTAPEALLNALAPGELCYQIFKVQIRWSRDSLHGQDIEGLDESHFEGLPEGRMWKSMQRHDMPKQNDTVEEIVSTTLAEWWPEIQEEEEDRNPGDPQVEVLFVRWETWCPGLHSHWAWDTGLDDTQVLASFKRFVERMEDANQGQIDAGSWQDQYCLMGAENQDRWYGFVTGEMADGKTDPPQRCSAESDIIRIRH